MLFALKDQALADTSDLRVRGHCCALVKGRSEGCDPVARNVTREFAASCRQKTKAN